MTTITLARTGREPLRFEGTLIASAVGQFVHTKPTRPNRNWLEVAIYSTPPPVRFVVAVACFRNLNGHLSEHRRAVVTDDPRGLLLEWPWRQMVIGYPPGDQFVAKQRRLEEQLSRQWAELLSVALAEFPETLKSGANQ